MLRRRDISAVILAGARFSECSLDAHAWVETDLDPNERVREAFGFRPLIEIGEAANDR